MLCCADEATFQGGQHMCDQVRRPPARLVNQLLRLWKGYQPTPSHPQLLLKHAFTDCVHALAGLMWCWGAVQT